ncbi:TonB-dependent receptor [Autumnicola psychrophila]|uniref:TonB-dependent receptor n=1 Tax=Autumnicola psychrophila TaxID=3075592 RepID=A0ABU3DTJ2_9FLAO|nr:TonB-dependent receptor [Zunongwangia sp. F225]MDT0686968.1 TonB-dependent receptor [Zunongwangia sp. F225]
MEWIKNFLAVHGTIIIAIFFTSSVFAQEITIRGKILDEKGAPLESATIHLETVTDSAMVGYALSKENGEFQLKGTTSEDKGNLFVSFAGFSPYKSTLKIKKEVNIGTIKMKIEENTLEEVMITATNPPVRIKKDTTEFNADSFQTRPDANLEEIMKKLPGVEIDREGNITINGTPISRIIVNGEEFFGDDPQIALKNLPKEIINRIQITDTKTESQEFTGESGDSNNKTVNITIKEDKNKGYFARATAGYGTDDRYEASGIFNYFNDEFRTSILASSNNINSSGFSYDETFGMMGRSAVRNDGGRGITKSESAGINAANEWNNIWGVEEVEASGDYFYGRNDTERRSATQTEYLIPGSRYFKNSERESNNLNDSHRANVEFEIEFDTLTRLSIESDLNTNFGESYSESFSESLNEDGDLINNTTTDENESGNGLDLDNEIDFTRRFGANGSFLHLEFSNSHEREKNENVYYSESIFFLEDNDSIAIQDQYIDEEEKEDQYSAEVRYRLALSPFFDLDASYDFDYSYATNQRYVYESDEENAADYTRINELLSNDFKVLSKRHSPNIGFKYEKDAWEIETDLGLLYAELENTNLFQETFLQNNYTNLNLEIEIEHEEEGKDRYSINYETEADIPSIRQLQPVVDRTDPLDIIIGNPDLRPTYTHDMDLRYRNYDYDTRSGISSWISFNLIQNDVVSVTTINDNLVRTTRFTNIDGGMNANAGISYSKQIKKEISQFRFRVRLNGSYDKNLGFTNATKFQAERFSFSPNLRFTYSIEEILEINPEYELSYQSSIYDINSDRNQKFINHSAGLEFTTYWPEDLIFANDISYRYLENVAPGFDNSIILWNLSLGYKFLKDDASVKIKVYDLLDQNVETRRIIEEDYIRDSSSLILTRYAMFSFTYKLSNIGGRNSME